MLDLLVHVPKSEEILKELGKHLKNLHVQRHWKLTHVIVRIGLQRVVKALDHRDGVA